ncbi:MAG: hypothetical protein GY803_31780 [Chloroflexi bacterium]|nr:hypothetical protein [Chloroflexota bacterium]
MSISILQKFGGFVKAHPAPEGPEYNKPKPGDITTAEAIPVLSFVEWMVWEDDRIFKPTPVALIDGYRFQRSLVRITPDRFFYFDDARYDLMAPLAPDDGNSLRQRPHDDVVRLFPPPGADHLSNAIIPWTVYMQLHEYLDEQRSYLYGDLGDGRYCHHINKVARFQSQLSAMTFKRAHPDWDVSFREPMTFEMGGARPYAGVMA